jgi:hypothetical protein
MQKVIKLKEFKNLLKKHFERHIESVNRVRRGEDVEGDYQDELEGPGVRYSTTYVAQESVNRARRGDSDEKKGEYEDEYEGAGVSYEALNLETNLYTDADCGSNSHEEHEASETPEEEKEEHEEGEEGEDKPFEKKFEIKTPSLISVFKEGYGLIETAPVVSKKSN